MFIRRTHLAIALCAGLCPLLVAQAQQPNLLKNASFEMGPAIPSGQTQVAFSGSSVPFWNVGLSQATYNNETWGPTEGMRSIGLSSSAGLSWIEQTIQTTPGVRYMLLVDVQAFGDAQDLQFSAAGDNHVYPRLQWFRSLGPQASFTRDLSWTFVAASSSTTVQIAHIPAAPISGSIHLDNVRVVRAQFGPEQPLPIDPLAFIDLNRDGFLDLVSASDPVTTYLADGSGGYVLGSSRQLGGHPGLVADFNLDGVPDLILASGQDLSIALGDGAGGFSDPSPAGGPTGSLAVGDMNSDGVPDLCSMTSDETVYTMIGLGDGSFSMGGTFTVPGFSLIPEFCDLSGDGHSDLVAAGFFEVTTLIGDGAGGFTPSGFSLGVSAEAMALGDFNGDKNVDIAAPNRFAGSLSTLDNMFKVGFGDGEGGFASTISTPILADEVGQCVAGDFDCDGLDDLFVNEWLVYSAGSESFVRQRLSLNLAPKDVLDLDGDGFLDVVGWGRVFYNQQQPPKGIRPFGIGTPGCMGPMGIGATSSPIVGNSEFQVSFTNVPDQTIGVLMVGGTDESFDPLLTFGLRIHIGLDRSRFFPVIKSGCSSMAYAPFPIPDDPLMEGMRLFAQGLWESNPGKGDTCSKGLFGLQTTKGLMIEIQG